jgi:hypothetical protein
MSVFYPKAMFWNVNKQFPEYVQRVNPGIKTVSDYLQKVYKNVYYNMMPKILIIGAIAYLSYILILKEKDIQNGKKKKS